jgi:hypothetical protein
MEVAMKQSILARTRAFFVLTTVVGVTLLAASVGWAQAQ